VDTKNKPKLDSMGGVNAIINNLRSNPAAGLNSNESFQPGKAGLQERTEIFGKNVLPEVEQTSIWKLMWLAMGDKILRILSVAAVISFGIGMYEDYVMHKDSTEPKVKWVEGVAILFAVMTVVLVSSINDYQKENQFRALNAKRDDKEIKLIRNGKECMVSVFDIKVGDIGLLEPGDVLSVDGVCLSSHNLKCDESSATGESELVKKVPYESAGEKDDCFILSGSKVSEGVGRFIVTAVGPNSYHGKTLLGLRVESEDTPLQVKLNGLAEQIAKVGSSVSILLLFILLVKFFI